nr:MULTISPECIES: TlpA disulfide reductase family protein [sulfur-oxidizing symbionts]
MPALQLANLQGEPIASSDWSGKVVVLHFWAAWNPICRREIPGLVRLQRELGERGLQMVGITLDLPQPARERAQELAINYPLLLGGRSEIALARGLGNRFQGLPFTALFDRAGRLVFSHYGELAEERLHEVIMPLL